MLREFGFLQISFVATINNLENVTLAIKHLFGRVFCSKPISINYKLVQIITSL